jgi:hypothetical protein
MRALFRFFQPPSLLKLFHHGVSSLFHALDNVFAVQQWHLISHTTSETPLARISHPVEVSIDLPADAIAEAGMSVTERFPGLSGQA